MPKLENMSASARKILPVIYVLDTSGSMYGTRISTVNQAMSETTDILKDVSLKNDTAEIMIGVLQFASNSSWITPENVLVHMDDFYWNPLSAAGTTDLTSALYELESKLTRSVLFDSDVGYKLPVIIFMSDGEPNDDSYLHALRSLESDNAWFKYATKIAIAIDDDCDLSVLANLTGTTESVIQVSDKEALKKLIRVVSATASLIGAKSRTNTNSTRNVMTDIKQQMDGDAVVFGVPGADPPEPPAPSDDDDDLWT
jgi:uncharacterized protein YegL